MGDLGGGAENFNLHGASVELANVWTVTVTGHGRVPVILDGETMKVGHSVTINFQPMAFRAFTPTDRV